jgi:hypothetical protein
MFDDVFVFVMVILAGIEGIMATHGPQLNTKEAFGSILLILLAIAVK